jgi:hypothetical protein
VEFIFYSINGYTGGTADDFKWSHLMDFNTFILNQTNIRINSNTYPQNGKIYWQRTITGTAHFDSEEMTVDISHSGSIDYSISSSYAYYDYVEQASGTSEAGSFSVSISDSYERIMMYDSNNSRFVVNTDILNNSSGNFSGTTYQYQNAHAFWAAETHFADSAAAGYYNIVIDQHQWLASGSMLKNNQQYGIVQFSGPVINYTYGGPDLILHLNTGNNILIHTLIGGSYTNIDNNVNSVYDFDLSQNYPNPFNPVTTIKYSIPEVEGSRVQLKIYDVLGNEIETLVNEAKPTGTYELTWNAANLPSGVYFYQLRAGSLVQTRKMILLK